MNASNLPEFKQIQAISVRRLMEEGHELNQVIEKSRTRYKIQNEFIPPRIYSSVGKAWSDQAGWVI